MSKSEKILSIILLSLLFLSFTSCVTKKKLKESQELTTTHILDVTDIRIGNLKNTLKGEISESVSQEVTKKFKEQKETISNDENESVEVIGTLPAGEGETSVTVGNTTIKNNGGNVSFDIKSSKQLSSQLETINKELVQRYNLVESTLISVVNEFNEFKTAQLKINEDLKSELDIKTKETDKKGLSFWLVIIAIVSAILFIAIKYFKVKLPF